MATKRRKIGPRPAGISNAAIIAWQQGDFHALNRLVGVPIWAISPFDAVAYKPDPNRPGGMSEHDKSWPRAMELRRQLTELGGPPGRVGRHGEPLGPVRQR